ncbi:MAG: alanine dehydrogenase [Spirochaetales bacterium]|nr:alanine dehydrogenase [Spirochaetales bacterium]
MVVGIPKEIKNNENRVGLTPSGVKLLKINNHRVLIEKNAGLGSGFTDDEYIDSGAEIISNAKDLYAQSEMIVKVKEPQPLEYDYLTENKILFTYLHLAPAKDLTRVLLEKKIIGIAYETVTLENGSLPLLIPMSEIAGKMATQIGAHFLEKSAGGRGILLGGVTGVEKGTVVIIGGGIVGKNAAKIALGFGANVIILDSSTDKLAEIDYIFNGKIQTIISNEYNISKYVKIADLLIGAVLIPGSRAPQLVTEEMIKTMKDGSVVIDVAIDQGGSIETIDRVTTHDDPVYLKHGVLHYAVANIPGAASRTSTIALTNVTTPYILEIANKGYKNALLENKSILKGLNLFKGALTCKPVADYQNLPYVDPLNLL